MDESNENLGSMAVYEIRVKGILTDQWQEWFDRMTLYEDPEGNTVLRGPLPDQAALHGLLDKVRDLGLTLLSVTKLSL